MIDKWEEEKYKQVNSRENSIFFSEKNKVCWKNFRFRENLVVSRSNWGRSKVIWGHLREVFLGGSMMSID